MLHAVVPPEVFYNAKDAPFFGQGSTHPNLVQILQCSLSCGVVGQKSKRNRELQISDTENYECSEFLFCP